MESMAQYDLELHQIDVKIAFLNGDLEEEIYTDQPKGSPRESKGQLSTRKSPEDNPLSCWTRFWKKLGSKNLESPSVVKLFRCD